MIGFRTGRFCQRANFKTARREEFVFTRRRNGERRRKGKIPRLEGLRRVQDCLIMIIPTNNVMRLSQNFESTEFLSFLPWTQIIMNHPKFQSIKA